MSLKYFDYDLTANLSIEVNFLLDYLGVQNADLANGIDVNDYIGSTSYGMYYSLSLSGYLNDGTNQTDLLSRNVRDSYYGVYYYIYESRLKIRTTGSRYGEGHVTINRFYPPAAFVDSITASPGSSLSASMDEFTIGSIIRFSDFYGWKKITYNNYDINNNLTTRYGWLSINGIRTGIDIIGSGTVSYTNSNDRRLKFTLTAAANIKTHANRQYKQATYPPFYT